MKRFEKYSGFFTGLLLVAAALYFLYSKGIIFANFESVAPSTAYEMIESDPQAVVLDVRTQQEYRQDGHLQKALLIPVQELGKRLGELEPYKKRKIFVYCRSGHRSVKAARMLADSGFVPINIEGGINAWKRKGLPVVR